MKKTTNGGGPGHKWTVREVITGQPVPFLLLTIVLFVILILGADKVLTAVVRGGNGNVPSDSTFVTLLLALAIAAAVLAVLILKVALGIILPAVNPDAAEKIYEKGHRFRWNILYSIVTAYIIFIALTMIEDAAVEQNFLGLWEDFDKRAFVMPIVMVLTWFASGRAARLLHRGMMLRTGSNKELAREILSGAPSSIIPPRYNNHTDRIGIAFALIDGQAFDEKSAVLVYWILRNNAFTSDGKRHKRMAPLGIIAWLLGVNVVRASQKDFMFYKEHSLL